MKLKYILIVFLLSSSPMLFNSCTSSSKKTPKEIVINQSDIVKKTIGVKGMTCVGCEVTLEKSISKITGVVSVKASSTKDEAVIEFDSTKTTIRAITDSIKSSGYRPTTVTKSKD